MKVVIPLTGNYDNYLGSYCDFTNWLGLSAPYDCPSPAAATAFCTNPRAIAAFEARSVLRAVIGEWARQPGEWGWLELPVMDDQGWFEPEWLAGTAAEHGVRVIRIRSLAQRIPGVHASPAHHRSP